MVTDDELTTRLCAARVDVLLDADAAERIERTVAQVAVRRLVRRRVAIGAVVLTLGAGFVAAPAAADSIRDFLAQTGRPCEGSECGGGDAEMVALGATDLDEYVASKYPDYLILPPGMERDDAIADVQNQLEGFHDDSSSMPDSAFMGAYEDVAYCAWVAEWLRAEKAEDLDARERAGAALTEALTWPGPWRTSPDPNSIAFQAGFAESARLGDVDGVQTAAQFHGCSAWDGQTRVAWLDDHRVAP